MDIRKCTIYSTEELIDFNNRIEEFLKRSHEELFKVIVNYDSKMDTSYKTVYEGTYERLSEEYLSLLSEANSVVSEEIVYGIETLTLIINDTTFNEIKKCTNRKNNVNTNVKPIVDRFFDFRILAYKDMLSKNAINILIKLYFEGLNVFQYMSPRYNKYTKEQIRLIANGMRKGLDVSLYSDVKFKYEDMRNIFRCLRDDVHIPDEWIDDPRGLLIYSDDIKKLYKKATR